MKYKLFIGQAQDVETDIRSWLYSGRGAFIIVSQDIAILEATTLLISVFYQENF